MTNMRKWLNLMEASESKLTALSLEFPFVKSYEDYHDITEEAHNLSKLFGQKIKSAEVGFSAGGEYWGVLFIRGRKPNKRVVKDLLDRAGYESDDDTSAKSRLPSKYDEHGKEKYQGKRWGRGGAGNSG